MGHTTAYRYDLLDRLTETIDAIGESTTYTYDELDRPISNTLDSFERGVAGKLPTVLKCQSTNNKAAMDSLQSILAEALAAVGSFTNPIVSFY